MRPTKPGILHFPPRWAGMGKEEAEAGARARTKATRLGREIMKPFVCRGKKCHLRIASLAWTEEDPPRPALQIWGPFARDADHDPARHRFALTGDPIPGTAMNLLLAAIPASTKVVIRCSCGHRSRLAIRVLQRLAEAAILPRVSST